MSDSDQNSTAKAALITGAARRLGREMAFTLAGDFGMDIAIHYRSSGKEAEDLKKQLQSDFGVQATTIQGDLNEPEKAAEIVREATNVFPHLNTLIHNASIYDEISFEDTSLNDLQKNMNIHHHAPFLMSQAFSKHLGDNEGNIITILDTKVCRVHTQHVPYILSKQALYHLTKLMAKELAPNIRVNGICPGPILPPKGAPDEYMEKRSKDTALKRHGEPEEIAEAVASLIKQKYITGNILYLDGGEHLL